MEHRPGELMALLIGLGAGVGLMFAPPEEVAKGREIADRLLQQSHEFVARAETAVRERWKTRVATGGKPETQKTPDSLELKTLNWNPPRLPDAPSENERGAEPLPFPPPED